MNKENEGGWICGFWRRIVALFIDGVLVGIVGYILGLSIQGALVEIGVYGRLVGFSIALIYFGVMNSKLCNGQTIGKKIMKIRVVDIDNKPISVARSLSRYAILGIPFILNGAHFSMEFMLSYWMNILVVVVFGGILSILYLYIFNRNTRQSLHDIVLGTYVVNAISDKKDIEKVWGLHLYIVGLLLFAAAVVPFYIEKLAEQEPFSELLKVVEVVGKDPLVNYVMVSVNVSHIVSNASGQSSTKFISAQVFLRENKISDVELAKKYALVVLNTVSNADKKDFISVVLIYGFDIGIASNWQRYNHQFTLTDLMSGDT